MSIHRVTFQLRRLMPALRTSAVPPTLSEGEKSKPTTSGRTNIVGKYYPQRLCHWADFESECRAAFARVQTVLGAEQLFPSVLGIQMLEQNLVEDLPSEFLASEAFINEAKTSHFIHETMQRPVQRILNAYLEAQGRAKTLYFDNRPMGWRPPSRLPTATASDTQQGNASENDNDTEIRRPPKTQPDCHVLCADVFLDSTALEAAIAQAAEAAESADEEVRRNARNVHRITVAEHKAAYRMRAAAVARYLNGAIDEDFMVQLAEVARRGKTQSDQETASREANRGPPGQVYFARAITQAFHYMVASGLEFGYLTNGETLTFLRVSADDPTTLLYHTALFPQYARRLPDGGSSAVPPAATADADVDPRDLAVSMLCALCLLALDSRPEAPRERSANISKLALFPDPPASAVLSRQTSQLPSSRESSSDPGSRKRPNDDDDDDDDEDMVNSDNGDSPGDSSGPGRGRLMAPSYQPRRPSPLKRQRSAADDAEDAVSLASSEMHHGKRRRVGLHSSRHSSYRRRLVLGPTLPSPLDPSTFRPIRPYCSQACLRSLADDGELDEACPNVVLHRQAHWRDGTDLRQHPTTHAIMLSELGELVRLQLLANAEQDCHCHLSEGLSGAVGCMFKITLTGYGYTFVAKGVESHYKYRLRREVRVYDALSAQQGSTVPVCLGLVQLLLPYPMDNGALVTHFLLMSYAGRPLYRLAGAKSVQDVDLEGETARTLDELVRAGLVDDDEESDGNLTWCRETRRVMKIDFDQARTLTLTNGTSSPASTNRTRAGSADWLTSALPPGRRTASTVSRDDSWLLWQHRKPRLAGDVDMNKPAERVSVEALLL